MSQESGQGIVIQVVKLFCLGHYKELLAFKKGYEPVIRVESQGVNNHSSCKIIIMGHYKDLLAYKKGYGLAMEIFMITKRFPPEERYSLTNQIRRSSRSVYTNLVEAYRRRRYKDFISKLNDCETENAETQVWLDFSYDCKYITIEGYNHLRAKNDEVGKLIWYMINNPDKFM